MERRGVIQRLGRLSRTNMARDSAFVLPPPTSPAHAPGGVARLYSFETCMKMAI